jgi:hypothetical protein
MKNWFPLLKTIFVWLARLIALLLPLYFLLTIIENVTAEYAFSGGAGNVIEKIVWLICFAIAAIFIFFIWWKKAAEINKIKANNQILLPIGENYIKATGESYVAYLLLMTIPGVLGVFVLGSTGGENTILPFQAYSEITAAILLFVGNIILSMIILGISYFLANNMKGR